MSKKIPSADICSLIDQHIEENGFHSHLLRLWQGSARKKWKREEMLEECLLEMDMIGGRVLHYACGSQRKRSKIYCYICVKYPSMLGLDSKDHLLSMMTHAAKCYLSQPTEGNRQNLQDVINGKSKKVE